MIGSQRHAKVRSFAGFIEISNVMYGFCFIFKFYGDT